MTAYHASVAIGHFARVLAARAKRSRHPTIVLLQALWLAVDPLADGVVVRVDFDDVSDVVASPVRLRQVIAELVNVGALERVDMVSRRYRLCKPAVSSLDEPARVRLAALHADLERAQRLVAMPANGVAMTKAERSGVLARLGKQPSDIRDVLAAMAGVAPGSLRYSGPGSGPVQAVASWLVRGGTWTQFVAVCEYVQQDHDRPAADIVWLFGDQHRGYLQRVVDMLSRRTTQSAAAAQTAADETEHRELAAQVAALLGTEESATTPLVVQARRSGVFAHEILAEARAFASGGARPDWMPA